MNAFEEIVKLCLEQDGYWVRQGVKVNRLTKDDKKALNKPSLPTPDIDLVAFDVRKNDLVLMEVKSYLDSYGVYFEAVAGTGTSKANKKDAERYRLLNDRHYQQLVSARLKEELVDNGLVKPGTTVTFGLAVGHFKSGEEQRVQAYFDKRGWLLFTPSHIKERLAGLAKSSYRDDMVTVLMKINRQ